MKKVWSYRFIGVTYVLSFLAFFELFVFDIFKFVWASDAFINSLVLLPSIILALCFLLGVETRLNRITGIALTIASIVQAILLLLLIVGWSGGDTTGLTLMYFLFGTTALFIAAILAVIGLIVGNRKNAN